MKSKLWPGLRRLTQNDKKKFPDGFPIFNTATNAWACERYLKRPPPDCGQMPEPPAQLKSHQLEAWVKLHQNGVLFLSWPMALGKSYFTSELACRTESTIFSTPRLAVNDVLEKFQENGLAKSSVAVIKPGKKLKLDTPELRAILTSHDSLHRLPNGIQADLTVLDEAHYMAKHLSERSQAWARLIQSQSAKSKNVVMTATPFGAKTQDLYGILSAMIPHGFGSYYRWVKYFHEYDNLGYDGALQIHGLRSDRIEELTDLLMYYGNIVDDSLAASLLPPVKWDMHWVDWNSDRPAPSYKSLKQWLQQNAPLAEARANQAAELLGQAGDSRTCFLVYFRETAATVAKKLGIPSITGAVSQKARAQIRSENHNIVATMSSINVGIDLREFSQVFILEPFPVPRTLVQAAGRFPRWPSPHTYKITIVAMRGTGDGVVLPRVMQRIEEHNKLIRSGSVASSMQDLLKKKLSDTKAFERLQDIFSQTDDDDSDIAWLLEDDF